MTEECWDDEALMQELTEALLDPRGLLPLLVRQGRQIFDWRGVDDDLVLAALEFDSRLEPRPARLRAGADEPRLMVFTAEPLSVELEVSDGRLTGQLVPPTAGRVAIETIEGPRVEVDVDELGFFALPLLGDGPVRLRCETASSRLVTGWVRL